MNIFSNLRVALGVWMAALAAGTIVQGGVVVETESDGTAINNTLATAQLVTDADFTNPVPPTVFPAAMIRTATIQGRGGDSDVDFYRFTVTRPGTSVDFDIDNDPFTFATVLSLFDSAGSLIALNFNSPPADPGSETEVDSFLGRIPLDPGDFFIAVSSWEIPNEAYNPFLLGVHLQRPDGGFGGWRLEGATVGNSAFTNSDVQPGLDYTLYISQAVPEPGSMTLMGLGAVGLMFLTSRRRGKCGTVRSL